MRRVLALTVLGLLASGCSAVTSFLDKTYYKQSAKRTLTTDACARVDNPHSNENTFLKTSFGLEITCNRHDYLDYLGACQHNGVMSN